MTINIHLPSTLKILVQGTAVTKNDCKTASTNHSITLVGYEPGYWIVLNSWAKKRILKDHTFFKLPWWKNFFRNEDGTQCFCGGIGDDCDALLFIHKFYDPRTHKKVTGNKPILRKSTSVNSSRAKISRRNGRSHIEHLDLDEVHSKKNHDLEGKEPPL